MIFSTADGNPEPLPVAELDQFGYLRSTALEVTPSDERFLNGTLGNQCVYVPDKFLPDGVSDLGAYVNENMRLQAEALMVYDALARKFLSP